KEILKTKNRQLTTNLIDIGTGSGNIIISIAKNSIRQPADKIQNSFIATDISQEALHIARKNISKHKLKNKIKVIHSSLLDFIFENKNYKLKTKNLIIIANLPYLSKKIYSATHPTVKNFEPKSALLSSNHGLAHYEKLLKQIKTLAESKNYKLKTISYLEISPEQKNILSNMIRRILPAAKINFYKDLSKRWRVCQVKI
ncbi:MAG: methyltransferase domain-containing protein, partial [Patescibacteria group bacterium]